MDKTENKFHAVSKEQASKDMDHMWRIAVDVANITAPLHTGIGWIARQNIGGYSFVIGKKHAHVSDEDLHTADHQALVKRCAEDMLGYPVKSLQHIKDLLAFWDKQLGAEISERDKLIAQVKATQDIIRELQVQAIGLAQE